MKMSMFGWVEVCLLVAAVLILLLRALPYLRGYRPLFGGGGALLLITALFPRAGNPIGEFLFGTTRTGLGLPRELFGIVWWILGAWLFKSLLDLALRRTFFPDNGEPHPRRIYADLASGLIYILAFVGIVGTVFKEPVSTFLATSGVLAIVLGLALQNTLGDVLAGLAINIERPFGAGDWITLADRFSGQVMQVNWRATRLRTWSHDMVVIPNSVVSKAIVTNHSRPKGPHRCVIRVRVDFAVAPSRVLEALKTAATGSPSMADSTIPQAYACAFSDSLVDYELAFAIDNFALTQGATSEMLGRISDTFRNLDIGIGAPAMDIQLIQRGDPAPVPAVPGNPAPPYRSKADGAVIQRHRPASGPSHGERSAHLHRRPGRESYTARSGRREDFSTDGSRRRRGRCRSKITGRKCRPAPRRHSLLYRR
jgi:small-conductance mechanosensitive channel